MATFASTAMAKDLADGVEDEPLKKKYEPKRLHTTEVSSLFDLKSEYLKKKNDLVQSAVGEVYRSGKSVSCKFVILNWLRKALFFQKHCKYSFGRKRLLTGKRTGRDFTSRSYGREPKKEVQFRCNRAK